MNQIAVMIDLETMGKAPTAAITSIGAVLFDPHGDWLGDSLSQHVDLQSCIDHGLTVDASTLIWWLTQTDEARGALVTGQAGAMGLFAALLQLQRFIPKDAEIWCNGASFDFAILANAYRKKCQPVPWKYYRERCLRTLKGLNHDAPTIGRTGIYHHALDDAIYQARQVQHILQFNRDYDA